MSQVVVVEASVKVDQVLRGQLGLLEMPMGS